MDLALFDTQNRPLKLSDQTLHTSPRSTLQNMQGWMLWNILPGEIKSLPFFMHASYIGSHMKCLFYIASYKCKMEATTYRCNTMWSHFLWKGLQSPNHVQYVSVQSSLQWSNGNDQLLPKHEQANVLFFQLVMTKLISYVLGSTKTRRLKQNCTADL